MPIATLTYDLSDPDDAQAHKVALGGQQMGLDLWELTQHLQRLEKNGNDDESWTAEAMRTLVLEYLSEGTQDLLNNSL